MSEIKILQQLLCMSGIGVPPGETAKPRLLVYEPEPYATLP
jgi:hypothetical protein